MFREITVGGAVYNERRNGVYVIQGSTLGAPADETRLKPNLSDKSPSVAITRYKHFVVPATSTTAERRVPAVVTMQIQLPPNEPTITAADVAAMVSGLAEFASKEETINRLFLGEG